MPPLGGNSLARKTRAKLDNTPTARPPAPTPARPGSTLRVSGGGARGRLPRPVRSDPRADSTLTPSPPRPDTAGGPPSARRGVELPCRYAT